MVSKSKLLDRRWFVENMLYITDNDGKYRRLGKAREEQIEIVEAWDAHPNVCVLKPRQVGSTTITQGLSFRDTLLCPDPISTLTMAHESGACSRINNMLRGYWRGLPEFMRPPLEKDNSSEIVFGHNGATMMQYMAGGRGQGRSRTYQQAIFTEMAFYPQGSASVKGKTDADRDAWASVLATMHKSSPYYKLVVESTGDGPGGQFHDIVLQAQEDPSWAFLFFRWFDFPMYELIPRDGFSLTADEKEFTGLYLKDIDPAVAVRKMAWRRHKMETEGYSMVRFRREYPSTAEEPFLLHESTWFDAELANKILGRLPAEWRSGHYGDQGPKPKLGQWELAGVREHASRKRVYHEPEPGRTYFIGGDSSGGTGGDPAVYTVLRDDYEIACVWSSNTTAPREQGNICAEMAFEYNNALTLVENNGFGEVVNNRLVELGVRVWHGPDGKRFTSLGGRAGQTKKKVYSYAQHLFNDQIAASAHPDQKPKVNDQQTLREIIVVREDEKGNIQAPSGLHDDHVDAWVFALWCGRLYTVSAPPTHDDETRMKFKRMGLSNPRRSK